MALWDKVRTELDRAGRVAQDAIDEGKIRLEAFRERQQADRAAQALGYAVYRARRAGQDIDNESFDRLSATLATHEAAAARLEEQLETIQQRRGGGPDATTGSPGDAMPRTGDVPPPDAATAGGTDAPPGAGRPSTDIPPI